MSDIYELCCDFCEKHMGWHHEIDDGMPLIKCDDCKDKTYADLQPMRDARKAQCH